MAAGLLAFVFPPNLIAQEPRGVGVITSPEFSVGVGFSPSPEGKEYHWSTRETEEANTLLEGDFQIEIDLDGGGISKTGPKFEGRILSSPRGGEYSGSTEGFSAWITAKYRGEKPKDAANDPNYRIRIKISQLSIYAAASFPEDIATLQFEETTANHSQVQDAVEIAPHPEGLNALGAYQKVEWAPATAAKAEKGITGKRSFILKKGDKNDLAVDGFEVIGEVVLEYDKQ